MKLSFKILGAAAVLAAVACTLPSCSSELSLEEDSFDTTVNFGGEAFSIPVGSTDEIAIGDFLEISEGDVIGIDNNGNYYIGFSQTFEQKISVSDFTDKLTVAGLYHVMEPRPVALPSLEELPEIPEVFPGEEIPDVDVAGDMISVDMGLDEVFSYEFGFEEAKDYGLVSIERVDMEETYLRPEIELESDHGLPPSLKVEVKLQVPPHYVFESSPMVDSETDIVTFTGVMDEATGTVVFQPLVLEAIDFVPGEEAAQNFVFQDEFAVTSSTLFISREDIEPMAGSELMATLTVKAGSDEGTLRPLAFTGKVDIDIDPVNESIELSDIPDVLKSEDLVLDFYAPTLTAAVSTNAGIPVNVTADVVPVFTGGDGEKMSLNLAVPMSDDPASVETANYWVASVQPDDMPAGYQFIEADIRSLLRRIPDQVRVDVLAGTDSAENAYVVCNADYTVTGEFAFNVPFAFGSDLHLAVRDTLYDMPEILTTVVKSASVKIGGTVSSTLPVNVELSAYFLDESLNVLDVPVVSQEISGTGTPGTSAETPLNLEIPRTELKKDIHALVFEFVLKSGDVPGISLSESSSIQADIVLNIPGGVTVDINDLNF